MFCLLNLYDIDALYKYPYSLRNVVSEKLQIPKAKTEFFLENFYILWTKGFRYDKLLLIMHLKQKLKVSFLNDDVP